MQLRMHNLVHKFDTISDHDLDTIVKAYKVLKPRAGLRYIAGFLRSVDLRVQRERIRLSLRRVDGLGQILRQRRNIVRRKYHVPRSNALWHLDGHHKLIWWGIVIHGLVDGRDHVVRPLHVCCGPAFDLNMDNHTSDPWDVS